MLPWFCIKAISLTRTFLLPQFIDHCSLLTTLCDSDGMIHAYFPLFSLNQPSELLQTFTMFKLLEALLKSNTKHVLLAFPPATFPQNIQELYCSLPLKISISHMKTPFSRKPSRLSGIVNTSDNRRLYLGADSNSRGIWSFHSCAASLMDWCFVIVGIILEHYCICTVQLHLSTVSTVVWWFFIIYLFYSFVDCLRNLLVVSTQLFRCK